MKANRVEDALDTFALVVSHDGYDSPTSNIKHMQVNWFATLAGECLMRTGDIIRAIKYLHHVVVFFEEYYEDSYDFHAYSPRKATLCVYTDLVTMQNRGRDHKYFITALRGLVEMYMRVHDLREGEEASLAKLEQRQEKEALEEAKNKMSAKERRALKEEEERKEAEEEQKRMEEEEKEEKDNKKTKSKSKKKQNERMQFLADLDPDGSVRFQEEVLEDPLKVASLVVQQMLDSKPQDVLGRLFLFDVLVRQAGEDADKKKQAVEILEDISVEADLSPLEEMEFLFRAGLVDAGFGSRVQVDLVPSKDLFMKYAKSEGKKVASLRDVAWVKVALFKGESVGEVDLQCDLDCALHVFDSMVLHKVDTGAFSKVAKMRFPHSTVFD